MARWMAFDFGIKRLGIAVTDPLKIIATGVSTIHPKEVESFLKKYMSSPENQIELFIIGEPKQTSGQESPIERDIQTFIKRLKKHFPHIPIERMDERFTSVMAQRALIQSEPKKSNRRKKELLDEISATLILQFYMDRQQR